LGYVRAEGNERTSRDLRFVGTQNKKRERSFLSGSRTKNFGWGKKDRKEPQGLTEKTTGKIARGDWGAWL